MRPVNLIPPEDRRGDRAPLRSGPLSYVIIGALAVLLLCVTALALTTSTIADREAEVAQLEVDRDAAVAEAQSLAPYAEFASLKQTREVTLKSLADSRFDWERVLRELSLIIPSDVSLTNLEGGVAAAGGSTSTSAETILGPSLTISGCAEGQRAVAGFLAALEDIDGVTRVGLDRSEKGDKAADGAAVIGAGGDCGSFISFDATAAFDDAAVAAIAPTAPTVPAPADPATPAPDTVETNTAENQTAKAKKKAEIIPGVAKP